MKTGELYIEQVLVGALVASIIALPWLPELRHTVHVTDTAALVAAGSVALAVAFWIGIPFDRLADTLSERLDQHNRLRFGLSRSLQDVPAGDEFHGELLGEDRLRVNALREGDGALTWIDYHRSRIRLTRALAFYGPGLTLALTLGLLRMSDPLAIPSAAVSTCLFGIASAYVGWIVLAQLGAKLPRTDGVDVVRYAKRWRAMNKTGTRFRKADSSELAVWLYEWRPLLVPVVMLALAMWLPIKRSNADLLLASLAGVAVTALSAWAWWRISQTYRTYLHDLTRFAKE